MTDDGRTVEGSRSLAETARLNAKGRRVAEGYQSSNFGKLSHPYLCTKALHTYAFVETGEEHHTSNGDVFSPEKLDSVFFFLAESTRELYGYLTSFILSFGLQVRQVDNFSHDKPLNHPSA